MKSLKESLFDSKTQTMESLFDKDLIQKEPGTLNVIVAYLTNYIKKDQTTMRDWLNCLDDIKKTIKYESRGWDLVRNDIPNNCSNNELYVSISYKNSIPALLLMTRGLIGDKEYSTEACPLVVIRYSSGLKTICADVYRTGVGTYDYKYVMNNNRGSFNRYKIDPNETKAFVEDIFNQIEQVF